MAFQKGDKIELTIDDGELKVGDCGEVDEILNNGNITVNITHTGPDCTPLDRKIPGGPFAPSELIPCHC